MENRKAFNFYRSYYDIALELPEEERLPYLMAIIEMQFTGNEPEGLQGMSKFAFISQKHSLKKQLQGYIHGIKGGAPIRGKSKGTITIPPKGNSNQEKEQVQGKEKEEVSWFLKYLNKTLNRSFRTYNKIKLRERLKTFKSEEIKQAILNASKNSFHLENSFTYLTPEFFTRNDQIIDKWLNAPKPKTEPVQKTFIQDMENSK